MFNRIVIAPPARSQTVYTEITEKRAPTDDSVKLLREMQGAARKEVLRSIKVADNGFECVLHFVRDPVSGDDIWRAIIRVHGTAIELECRTQAHGPLEDRIGKLVAAISDRLAQEIVRPALTRTAHSAAGRVFFGGKP